MLVGGRILAKVVSINPRNLRRNLSGKEKLELGLTQPSRTEKQ